MARVDISTVSRVTNSKYVQTMYGTYPLKFFFSSQFTTSDGDELSARKVIAALRELIDGEDKRHGVVQLGWGGIAALERRVVRHTQGIRHRAGHDVVHVRQPTMHDDPPHLGKPCGPFFRVRHIVVSRNWLSRLDSNQD